MSQPVMSVLSHQHKLAAAARLRLGDANEAGLVVGKLILRALDKLRVDQAAPVSSAALMRELDAMIGEAGAEARRPG